MKNSMLKLSRTIAISISVILTYNQSFSQTPTPWYLGGQTTAGEVIGTINSQPFTIITNNTPRFYFTTIGSFGLNAASPNYRFQAHETTALTANYLQVSNNTTGSASGDGLLVGLDASGNALLNQQENLPVIFNSNAIERMRLLANGNLGIGTATPTYLLDVNGGDINLTNDANFYRIQGREALYFDGSNNLMVGTAHGAGLFSGAIRNTMVGVETGLALTSGDYNVFLGNQSGRAFTTGIHCTFSGYQSGLAVTTGEYNSFFGSQSGPNVTTGTRNTFMGYCAGGNLTVGSRNVFIGHQAGADLSTSATNEHNVIMGAFAGNSAGSLASGKALTLLGYNSEAANGLTNSGAIGSNAYVNADDCLVLGSITGVNNAATSTNVGIGTTAPANRLEIVSATAGSNISGLRLTSLVGSTPASPTGGVLSIDGSGDVILVRDSTGGGDDDWHITGNNGTNDAINYIGTNDEQDFVFKTDSVEWMRIIGGTTNQGKVGIHTSVPTASLHVVDDESASATTAIYGFAENGSATNFGIHGEAESNGSSRDIGVQGTVDVGSTTSGVQGVFGRASTSSATNSGGVFYGTGSASGAVNYGVYGKAQSGTENYGVYGVAVGTQSSTNCAGYFSGNAYASGMFINSDQKLKRNIIDMEDAVSVVKRLRPVSYEYQIDKFPQMNLQNGVAHGFVAQEVEEVIPSLVTEFVQPEELDASGVSHEKVRFKALNYIGAIPFLTKAIQEQQEMLEEKEDRIVSLEMEMSEMKKQLAMLLEQASNTTEMDVTVGFADNATSYPSTALREGGTELHQNRPNPFREMTTFSYSLANSGKLELNIYSMEGAFVETITSGHQEKGEHKVAWDSKDIPNGMYFYILTVDGVEWVKKAIRLR